VDRFLIGARRGEHVEVHLTARALAEVEATIHVRAAGLRAEHDAAIRIAGLVRFRDALRALDEGRDVHASLDTRDGWLKVRVSRADADEPRFAAECYAVDATGTGNLLKFVVAFGTMELAELVWSLDGTLRDLGAE